MSFLVSLGSSLISVVLKWFQQHLQGALDSMGWEGNSQGDAPYCGLTLHFYP